MEEDTISIILITSPCPSMPSLSLIQSVLDSLRYVVDLERYLVHTYILMDGFKSALGTRFKKGRISESHQELYHDYYNTIMSSYGAHERFTVERSPQHLGFAMMVKWGLEMCKTKFALILQHDRCFRQTFSHLHELVKAFNRYDHVRYIGFPTGNSHKHDLLLRSPYKLEFLTQDERIQLEPENLSLQPLIFWFDSQHLAHVQRYLEIFTPHRSLTESLRPLLGIEYIKNMVLRRGDFIEDRFGQAQRNIFAHWQKDNRSAEEVRLLFRWFGSFLCWQIDRDVVHNLEGPCASVLVNHIHGRSLDLVFLDGIATAYGVDRIPSYQHRQFLVNTANLSAAALSRDENTDKMEDDASKTRQMEESFTQIRTERRRKQHEQLMNLLHENGMVMEDSEALGEAMQLLQIAESETFTSDNSTD